MSIESDHQDHEFQRKKTAYFQKFMLRHMDEARKYKKYGLLNEEGSEGWRNVARHQLLSAVMAETLSELLGRTSEETAKITIDSLLHDVEKRRQQEGKSKNEVWKDEFSKNKRPFVATSSNFTGVSEWGDEENILRWVDSSVGEEVSGHWYGSRDPKNLPPVVIVPWRDRVGGFKVNKIEEGELGREKYGMTTWEKLEQVMASIESNFFNRIIENHPELAERYTESAQLTELVEERIHQKIEDFGKAAAKVS